MIDFLCSGICAILEFFLFFVSVWKWMCRFAWWSCCHNNWILLGKVFTRRKLASGPNEMGIEYRLWVDWVFGILAKLEQQSVFVVLYDALQIWDAGLEHFRTNVEQLNKRLSKVFGIIHLVTIPWFFSRLFIRAGGSGVGLSFVICSEVIVS